MVKILNAITSGVSSITHIQRKFKQHQSLLLLPSLASQMTIFLRLASNIILTHALFSYSLPLEMFFWLAFQDFKTVKWSEVYSGDTFISPDSFVKWDHYGHVTRFALSLNQYFFHWEVARGISRNAMAVRENEFEQKWEHKGI